MKTRRAEAFWYEKLQRWQINVQREGVRKTFCSSLPGRKGKHEAEAKADKWLERFTTDQAIYAALDMYIEDKRSSIKAESAELYAGMIGKHIKPRFQPGKRLSMISEYDWQQVINKCSLERESSQKALITLIKNFVSYCKSRRWEIADVEYLTPKEGAAQKKGKRALTSDELRRLLMASDLPMIEYFKLLVLTGCRKSELVNVKWADIDSETIHVRSGKTANAARFVPMNDYAKRIIDGLKTSAKVSEYVFPNRFGEITSINVVNAAWKRVTYELGLQGVTIHELRHTFISVCKGSISEVLLKQAVGHSASMDTYGVYGHQTEADVIDTAKESGAAFERVLFKK